MLLKHVGPGCRALAAPLVLGALVASLPAVAETPPGRSEGPTTADLVRRVPDRAAHAKDRVDAIARLGGLSSSQEVRDQRVVEALVEAARPKDEDLFVRQAACKALASLQRNLFATDRFAKGKYLIPFIEILKDRGEDELMQTTVAEVFADTLEPNELQDRQAVAAMMEIAEDKNAPLTLRLACIRAVGRIGPGDGIKCFVEILRQTELDPLVKEVTLQALADWLTKVSGNVDVPLPVLNKIMELIKDKTTPMEIRARALVALAELRKRGAKGIELLPEIRRILKQEENSELVIAAVKSVGIMEEDSALADLLAAYTDFFDQANVSRENDVRIRLAVVQTLSDLLSAQVSAPARKKIPNAAVIKQVIEQLLKIVDPATEPKDVSSVVENAIFGLRYAYPRQSQFQNHHQKIAEKLILLWRKGGEQGEHKQSILTTLKTVTRMPFETLERWERWYDQTYPAFKLPKVEQ